MDCDYREEVALQLGISGGLASAWFTLAHHATLQKTFVLSCSSDSVGPAPSKGYVMIRKAWLCAVTFSFLILSLPGAVAQYANQTQEANAILMQINQASSDAQR